jgi:elongation factor Ts
MAKKIITSDQIKKLRDKTGVPIMRVKKVLEEMMGDLPADATHQALQAGEKKAEKLLEKEGFEKAAKRKGRETSQGLIEAYVHHSGKVASMIELLCETDFVARNKLFRELAHNLVLQAASMEAKGTKEFMKQEFIKDPSKTIGDLVKETIVKTGENIRIGRVIRVELGKE